MIDQQKISIGRLRQAYNLTDTDVDELIQALWPNAVFPAELWHRAHDKFWRDFADSNQAVYDMDSPTLPQANLSLNRFQTYMFAHDIMDFFRRLSLNIHVNALKQGLAYILEESYEDTDSVFTEERELLFNSLNRLETEDFSEQYSPDSDLFDKPIFFISISSYHFIAYIFVNTIMVDRDAAIKQLRNFPLCKEQKGITQALLESILKTTLQDSADEKTAMVIPLCERSSQDGKLVFSIPSAVWEGRPEPAVRDTMREKYPLAVIAYVLLYWCGSPKSATASKNTQGRKTYVGRLLAQKEYRDDKSYRNLMDALLQEAESYSIFKA